MTFHQEKNKQTKVHQTSTRDGRRLFFCSLKVQHCESETPARSLELQPGPPLPAETSFPPLIKLSEALEVKHV